MTARGSDPERGALWVGCSGFDYDAWSGGFYPEGLPRRDRLAWYAAAFNTVELNTTFYRLPGESTVTRWRSQVPSGFLFAVKLSRYGTHRKRLRDPDTWLVRFVARVQCLGAALGPVLAQLPPRWHVDTSRLDAFLLAFRAAAGAEARIAIELRDRSWWRDEVWAVLARHGAALVQHDRLGPLGSHPRVLTAPWTYFRFHGPDPGRPWEGSYPAPALGAVARRIDDLLADGFDVHAYFDNDASGAAPTDARRLARLVERRAARRR